MLYLLLFLSLISVYGFYYWWVDRSGSEKPGSGRSAKDKGEPDSSYASRLAALIEQKRHHPSPVSQWLAPLDGGFFCLDLRDDRIAVQSEWLRHYGYNDLPVTLPLDDFLLMINPVDHTRVRHLRVFTRVERFSVRLADASGREHPIDIRAWRLSDMLIAGIITDIASAEGQATSPDPGLRSGVQVTGIQAPADARPFAGQTMARQLQQQKQKQKQKLWVVDDHPMVAGFLTSALAAHPVTVTAWGSGTDLVNHLARGVQPADLLICDWNLPDMTGLSLIAAVRQRFPQLPVILCTGDTASVPETALVNQGVLAIIEKPLDISRLLDLMETLKQRLPTPE